MNTLTRIIALVGAVITWTGLGLQLYILATGELGPIGGTWRFLAYFTVLMNILAACLFTVAVFNPSFSPTRARLQAASAAYMTFVGVTYVLLLENTWNPEGLQLIADKLLHYAAPIVAVAFWFFCVPKSALRWSDALRWAGVPLVYLAYALVRASFDAFYPYFFIDVGQHGWSQVAINCAGMLVAFVALGLVMVAIGKLFGRISAAQGPSTA